MDFGLAEDQVLFEQTIRSFLADRVSIQQVREFRDADSPLDRSTWQALAELGVTGILALLVFVAGYYFFDRLRDSFAEAV